MSKSAPSKTNVKNSFKYYCQYCDYGCSRCFLMTQHETTQKHILACSPGERPIVCSCGKTYKHVQSLKRHMRSCSGTKTENIVVNSPAPANEAHVTVTTTTETQELRAMISALLAQNSSMLGETEALRGIVKDLIPRVGSNNTTVNAQFNINMFLNETCKDALNLTDFVETLHLETSDLDITRQNGYAAGIANIFLKGLQQLDLHKRPIHCSDLKREILYVKDNDTWGKECDDKPKIKNAISAISKLQVNAIKEWEAEHPEWRNSDSGTQEFCEMVKHVTGSDALGSDDKIIRTIAKEVIIDK